MKGATGAMRNIGCEEYFGARLDRATQLHRVRRVISRELSPCQKQVVEGIYYEKLSQSELARRMGVNRSTVCRTLRRARDRLKRCLTY